MLCLPSAAGSSSALVLTSPVPGTSLSGTQAYVIGGTITPVPALPDSVFISVRNPQNMLVDVQTVSLSKNGSFSYSTNAGGSSAWTMGRYTITAEDSDNNTGSVTFSYVAQSTAGSSSSSVVSNTSTIAASSSSATSTASTLASTASSASSGSSVSPLVATGVLSVLALATGALALAERKRNGAGSGPTVPT